MSTPTPIEIVREFQLWRRADGKYASDEPPYCFIPHTPEEIGLALDSVLRDAERFKALEAVFAKHNNEGAISAFPWKGKRMFYYTHEPDVTGSTLAELADKLREAK